MTLIGQIVPPDQCDENGDPLDWKCCRACEGRGYVGGTETSSACWDCGGHGSLEAAALIEAAFRIKANAGVARSDFMRRWEAGREQARCEDCNHLMSEGMWEFHPQPILSQTKGDDWQERAVEYALFTMQMGDEPDPTVTVTHFSRCDEKCNHGGPGRIGYRDPIEWFVQNLDTDPWDGTRAVEASWRPVAVRTGIPAPPGHPHPMLYTRPFDLRLENLAVLCLRCWAAR